MDDEVFITKGIINLPDEKFDIELKKYERQVIRRLLVIWSSVGIGVFMLHFLLK